MKVLVVNNMAPFVWGGAEELATHLQKNLIIAGHEAEVLRIPFQWEPASKIPSQMLMARAFELWNVDHVIGLKFPAYLVRHHSKTLWILHQYRQAYDLFNTGQTNVSASEEGLNLQTIIRNADEESFLESRRIFTISNVTQARLKKFNNVEAEVLFPPLNDAEIFGGKVDGGYIFAGGRVNDMKRQHLLLEALRHSDKRLKLVIAGPPDSHADAMKLKQAVSQYALEDRVTLDLRFMPRTRYAQYVNEATAVAYVPFNEDYGYVAVEAAAAGKALLTTTDSGGVLGLVRHAETGWVMEPNAHSLAEGMNAIWLDRERARRYGAKARELWASLNINWPKTIETLLP